MRETTIRRPVVPVIGVWTIGLCGLSFFVFNAVSHQAWALLYLAAWTLIIPVMFLVDYLSWKVIFTKTSVRPCTVFSKRSYSYSEIKKVREFFRSVDNQYKIIIQFTDGRKVAMLSSYKNYMNARTELLRHTSISFLESR